MKKYAFRAVAWTGLPAPVRSFLRGEAVWNTYRPPRSTLKADIEKVLHTRNFSEDARRRLVSVIRRQKAGHAVAQNLASRLENPKCFAITTGHQPVLMGGPLFFWYKILGTLTLAARCREWFPEYDFVPVFWLAGEDHDLAEVFTFYGPDEKFHRFVPEDNFTGAAGRYPTAPIHTWIRHELATQPLFTAQPWFPLFDKHYGKGTTLAVATLNILDDLLADAGLLSVNPDDPELKEAFRPYFEKELKTSFIRKGLQASESFFAQQGFKLQIHGREINFFWLDAARRLPVEKISDARFRAGENIFSPDELLERPENLSPNVAMRPLYQEAVLPSVAYVGGPAEFHYWLQLKPVFEAAVLPMPEPVLRPILAWLPSSYSAFIGKSGLNPEDLFKPLEEQLRQLAAREADASAILHAEAETVRSGLQRMRDVISLADTSLEKSADATLTRFEQTLKRLENLSYRAWKKRRAERVVQLQRLHLYLFPQNVMQERLWSIWNLAFMQDMEALFHLFKTFQEEHIQLLVGDQLS
jgi:bacillithiol biosynthesis cysteine-adding enzyme BshC